MDRARDLLGHGPDRPRRLIVASHYPAFAPANYAAELKPKRLSNDREVIDWLATIGPHLYCCGHVHAAWSFVPPGLPEQLCLNSGAPLLRDPTGLRPPGFLEIEIHDRSVSVLHHAWIGGGWEIRPLHQNPAFFPMAEPSPSTV